MRYEKYIKEINLLLNLLAICFSFLAFQVIETSFNSIFLGRDFFSTLLLFSISWVFASIFTQINDSKRNLKIEQIFKKLLNAFGFYLLFIFLLLFLRGEEVRNDYIFKLYFFSIIFISLFQTVFTFFMKSWRRSGHNFKKVVIAGYGDIAEELAAYFQQYPENGYSFLGFFGNGNSSRDLRELNQYCLDNEINEIYCCTAFVDAKEINRIINFAEDNFIKVKVIPDYRGFKLKGVEPQIYDYIPVLSIKEIPLDDPFNKFLKRSFDVLFSFLVIVFILSWLVPILGLLIKMESKGPVFFKQKRSGINNEPFWCFKFRSMGVNRDADNKQATKNDVRITKIGAFIRKTSIDELPQFINVLKGEMSVVGPRPHMLKHTEEYSKIIERFMVRHEVKPGVTGLAQAKGYRGETETTQDMKNRVTMDKFYVANWTFIFDLKIILMTIDSIFNNNENAY
ncbi:undecaprenyl-phosphate glucose phosphotransferase [Aureibacter tunicatorum]|uniref:Undecaprenyl-phosphate glucose phosphotransferase n=1 Tax=Aureibacter tunicatorum TaxID=866807 RepID=A0AAE4BSV4_9BACT|nr:undecaprenyl-phosphate glucose phosphotransferase [Aureibacter tunicatorum]MDR6240161.1 Undecaprenyl-phosphate glucose phosphotransferase [Aureibacter tunicatorum]BDD05958.1 undecaprenyl-phosphate glucose phosphotransferase [Aureibacter tunicatorum]